MTSRFIPPAPNCGHVDGVTFTHDRLSGLWRCPKCETSLRGLAPHCARCGWRALPGHRLLATIRGLLCFLCRREMRAAFRL